MSVIWNTSDLCRCCHAEGNYKSLNIYPNEEIEDCYFLLRDTFNIVLNPPPNNATSYAVCSVCAPRLRDAAQFKKQVLLCEEKLKEYLYSYSDVLDKEVKKEFEKNELKEESTHEDQDRLNLKYDDDSPPSMEIFISPVEDDDQPLSVLKSSRSRAESSETEAEWAGPPDLSDDDLKNSKKRKTVPKFACDICDKKFSYNGSLEVHMKAHNGEKTFTCHLHGYCSCDYFNYSLFKSKCDKSKSKYNNRSAKRKSKYNNRNDKRKSKYNHRSDKRN
ncbi:hypothetical protein PYW08_010861 [Mythimna loreyi]|uniref:Uncharacterized protein n=1 Tax=Mythimna loreyi TaxID=667449 RepID=A0ACC2Q4G0_9NEOP|nr:hypothetical protein PYW08_010861 [Mythimna loreyi]